MKITQMIKHLNAIKKHYGDLDIIMSRDSEGNGFGTIEDDSLEVTEKKLVLYPCEERCDFEDL